MHATNEAPQAILAAMDRAGKMLTRVREGIGRVIYGQTAVIDQALVTLLAGGHGLLVGVPGLAKTRLVETLGITLGLEARRIQFTPDLMPADIVGSEVLEDQPDGRRGFRFVRGPVFCQLLMADEINRASPRTQSALLQAMQEQHVTIAGVRYELPRPFHVLATQNPLEQEGTYPLPEAQLDRFLLQIDVHYPDAVAERQMLLATTGPTGAAAEPVLEPGELTELQELVRLMPVGHAVLDGLLRLVRSGRPGEPDALDEVNAHVAWGPGPRAAQALMLCIRARALLDGRFAPSIDDVAALAPAALRHRMAISFRARAEGVALDEIIAKLVAQLG